MFAERWRQRSRPKDSIAIRFASAFKLLDELKAIVDLRAPLPNWRDKLPKSSSWWFLVDRYFAQDPLLTDRFCHDERADHEAQ